MKTLFSILALSLLTGCVQLRWFRNRSDVPIREARLADLQVDHTGLGLCLRKFGAPHIVGNGPNQTIDLVYAWVDDETLGLTISYEITSWVTGSFTYDDRDASLFGLLLRFSQDLVLREVRIGQMTEIVTGGRDPTRYRRSSSMPNELRKPPHPRIGG